MPRHLLIILWALLASVPLTRAPALALPDAQILRITAQGSDFRSGDQVPLQVDIRNAGDAPLPPVPVILTMDHKPYAEWKLAAELPPQHTVTWSLTWIASRGSHLLMATVDPFNEVLESDESSNSTFLNLAAIEREPPFPWLPVIVGALSFLISASAVFFLHGVRAARHPPRSHPIPSRAEGSRRAPSERPPG